MENGNLEWCNLPAGETTITYSGSIELGPDRGKSYTRTQTYDVEACLISRHPITNTQYQAFVAAPDGYANRGWWRFQIDAIKARRVAPYPSHPFESETRTNISWWEARAFCRWLSARTGQTIMLPPEPAWLLAAQTSPSGFAPPESGLWEWCLGEKTAHNHQPTACLRKDVSTRRERIGLASAPNLGFRVYQPNKPAVKPAADDLLKKLYGEKKLGPLILLLDQLAELGSVACVPYLIEMTQNKSVVEQTTAVSYLGLLGDSRAFETLARLAERPDHKLRRAAVEALGFLGDLRAIPVLIKTLHSDNMQLRGGAMMALLQLDVSVFDTLLDLAETDTDPGVRRQAVSALRAFHHTPAITRYQTRLATLADNAPEETLRAAAADCLESERTAFVSPHGFLA